LLAQVKKADVVVLDPPRAGVDPTVVSELLRLNPRQILYISCDPATLARDVAALTQSKAYEIATVNMYNLYPRTHHLESVVLLNSTR
jgi:23S rRNA (uracil1939-C5)-methyltransferase